MYLTTLGVIMFEFKQNHPLALNSQSEISYEIEQLVNYIAAQKQSIGFYYIHWQGAAFSPQFYYGLRAALPLYLSIYDPSRFEYSEHLDAFFHGCHRAGIMMWWDQYREGHQCLEHLSIHLIYQLVQYIDQYMQMDAFRRAASDRAYNTACNRDGLIKLYDAWQDHYSRLLIVRADLYYRVEYRHLINIHTVYQHTDQLLKRINKRRGLFEHLATYARSIEQGEHSGYHLHLGLCFKGSHHQQDCNLYQQIEQLWQEITGGMGYGHSSNLNKDSFIATGTNGVGMIHRDDLVGRGNAQRVLSYLTTVKDPAQHLRIKPIGLQAFSKGQMP
jgi:hypothetical protein